MAYGYKYSVCDHCSKQYEDNSFGRPSRYCSSVCRQRAYRRRKDNERHEQIIDSAKKLLAWRDELDRKLELS